MNSPKSRPADSAPQDIGDVRRQIDKIDADLAALIVQRCGLSASVSAAKHAQGDVTFGWRPAREVEILRSVLRDQASLHPELAFSVWRALISANLAAQGDLRVFTTEQVAASAKAAFCVGTISEVVPTTNDVLQAVVKDDHSIGIVPWPTGQDWWVTMMEPQFASLYVCAASPLYGSDVEVLLVSARMPEAAGDDICLIAGPVGAVEGGVLAQANGFELVACGEFMTPDTPLPTGCRLIGSFALA
jgi:chorismate mutase